MAKNKILISGDFVPDNVVIENEYYFSDINNIIDEKTIHITNLECPLTSSEIKINKTGPNIKSKPEMVDCLKRARVDVACLANNHIKDYDSTGIADTIKICNKNNIHKLGAGISKEEATIPLIVEVGGQKVGILNYCEEEYNGETEGSYGANIISEIDLFYDIFDLKLKVDKIIVLMHWGKELYRYPTPNQQKLAKYVLDLGADAIIGHHSHVRGSYEYYQGKPIIYSLGNFYFNETGESDAWYQGLLCEIKINDDMISASVYPTANTGKKLEIGSCMELCNDIDDSVLLKVNEQTIKRKWEELLEKNFERSMINLLNPSKFKRIKYKIINKINSKNDQNYLMSLGNRFRCKTYRYFTSDLLNKLNKENNK